MSTIQTQQIQKCLKRLRECDDIIEKGVKAKKQKTEIEKQLKSLKIDLVRDKKIERVNMTFKQWLEETDYQYFYVYRCQDVYEYIVWKGLDDLNTYETAHFDYFIQDYLVNNHPDYTIYDELSLTHHGFEDGDLGYFVHCRRDYN